MKHFKILNPPLKSNPLKGALSLCSSLPKYFAVLLFLVIVTLPKLNFSNTSVFYSPSCSASTCITFPKTTAIQFTKLCGKIKDTEQHFDLAISPFEIEEDEDTLQHKKHSTNAGGPYCAALAKPSNQSFSASLPIRVYGNTLKVLTGPGLVISNRNFRI